MSPRWYVVDGQGTLREMAALPAGSRPIAQATELLLPPLISSLHRNFHAWQTAGLSPNPIVSERVWIDPAGGLAVGFAHGSRPAALYPVGAMAGLAAWLVLLDKWVETFVVIARARAIWSPAELAGALSFTTPSLLPPPLVRTAPDHWQRVALALALAVADGPLAAAHTDRHWSQ